MSEKKRWLKYDGDAVAPAPVKNEGVSNLAYEHERDNGETGKQTKLAEQLMSMSNAHNTQSASNKSMRNSMYGSKD